MSDYAPTLTAGGAPVDASRAEEVVRELWGIEAEARPQAGERDDNFVLRGRSGEHFLKVVHPAEPQAATDLVTAVLLHLQHAGDVPVQSVVRTRGGEAGARVELDGVERAVRLTTYIPGALLRSVPSRPALEESLGATLARVGRALRDFKHPAAEREVAWDLWWAGRVAPMLDELRDDPQHGELEATLAHFEEEVRPRLAGLRRQLVHNDLSGDNVVVSAREDVAGLIDFGDATVTQLVNDVAIAMTNRLVDGADPLVAARELLRGYHAVEPLEPAEVELLCDLVRTRTAMRLVITQWRARRFPGNRTYILRNTPQAREHFARLPAAGAPEATARLVDVLGQEA